MAGGSFLALLDDITTVLDDVATMTKVAAKKTAGVVGDDLALNAQQVTGVNAERELPIVWAVAKGSFWNKVKIIPLALGLSAISTVLVTGALMIGGTYLCYEGAEKIFEKFMHSKNEKTTNIQSVSEESTNLSEADKIQGAIKTDFILSGEIMVISLGSAATLNFWGQVGVLSTIGLLMTVGVYGLVAAIVKADDIGYFLMQLKKDNFSEKFAALKTEREKAEQTFLRKTWQTICQIATQIITMFFYNNLGIKILNYIGKTTVILMPRFMKFLTVLGTLAMFMVGGGIFTHALHDWAVMNFIFKVIENTGVLVAVANVLVDAIVGLVIGALTVGIMEFGKKIFFVNK